MKTLTTVCRTSIRSPREIAIQRLAQSIRTGDRQGARHVWEQFEKKGERISRELVAAYRLLM
jgi:hypothetical protein